jgi:hypothetical protein
MEGIRNHAQAVPFNIDISDAFRPFGTNSPQMTFCRNPDAEAAMQYLTWALEEMEKAGSQTAARHTRAAIAALRKRTARTADKD